MAAGELLENLTTAINNFGDQDVRILLLGLDAAGKESVMHFLKLKGRVTTTPKIGFTVMEVTPIKNVTFIAWDAGGKDKVLKLKRQYYQGADGLAFIVDATDLARIDQARDELYGTLKDHTMYEGVPLMVFANKQNVPDALKAPELVEKMKLEEITSSPWYVQELCANTGNGLPAGITALAEMVKEFQQTKPGK